MRCAKSLEMGKKLTIIGTSDYTFELETPRTHNGTFEPQMEL